MPPGPEPVLDPFEVGGRNLDVLRQELSALNRPRLLNIISAYEYLELRFDRFMLQPGTYDISASINDYTCTHIVDYMRRCLRFDVVHGDPRETGGYVALGGKWSPLTAEG